MDETGVERRWVAGGRLVDPALANAQPGQLGFVVCGGSAERPVVRLLARPALGADGVARLHGRLGGGLGGESWALGVGRVLRALDDRAFASSPCSMTIGAEIEILEAGGVDEAEALAALGWAELASLGELASTRLR